MAFDLSMSSDEISLDELGFHQLQIKMDDDPFLNFPGISLATGLVFKPLIGAIEIIFGIGCMFAGLLSRPFTKDWHLFVKGTRLTTLGLWHTFKGVAWSSLVGPLVKRCVSIACVCLGKEYPFRRAPFAVYSGKLIDLM